MSLTYEQLRYQKLKTDPTYVEGKRTYAKDWYSKYKNTEEFKLKRAERQRIYRMTNPEKQKELRERWYTAHKNDPNYKAHWTRKASKYYTEHKLMVCAYSRKYAKQVDLVTNKTRSQMNYEKQKQKPEYGKRKKQYSIKERVTRYGLSLNEYNDLLLKQNNKCAICKEPETVKDSRTKTIKSLSIDHDHATNKVRGLLCNMCNTGLGRFRDNIDLMTAATNYLMSNK